MHFRFGDQDTSQRQRQLIDAARSDPTPKSRLELLKQLLEEPDVQQGKETIDTIWIKLCPEVRRSGVKVARGSPLAHFRTFLLSEFAPSPALDRLDPDAYKLVFLLGAGASRPAPSNIPVVRELLPDLLSRARRQDRDDLTNLADFCDRHRIHHIEDLLTAAQLSGYCSRHPDVLTLVNFLLYGRRLTGDSGDPDARRRGASRLDRGFRGPAGNSDFIAYLADTLQTLFGLISGRMLPAQPNDAHKAVARYCTEHPDSVILTTNYDCCVDLALQDTEVKYSYAIDFANCAETSPTDHEAVALLKLHGSLNWFYCDTCQDVHLVPIERALGNFLGESRTRIPYPVIGHCDRCGGLRRPMLVPPQALKFDLALPLNPLIERATRAFAAAELIVVVGFSFADSDLHITRVLTRGMRDNRDARLLVVDPDIDVARRISRKLSQRISAFDPSRVLKLPGDCASTLPSFLDRHYFEIGEVLREEQGEEARETPEQLVP